MTVAEQLSGMAVEDVLKRCGCQPHRRRGRWAPCPACGAADGTVVGGRHTWRCHACGASMTAASTARLLATGSAASVTPWAEVAAWAVAQGWATDDGTPARRGPAPLRSETVRGVLPALDPGLVQAWGEADAEAVTRAQHAVGVSLEPDYATCSDIEAGSAVLRGLDPDYALDAARAYLDAREQEDRAWFFGWPAFERAEAHAQRWAACHRADETIQVNEKRPPTATNG